MPKRRVAGRKQRRPPLPRAQTRTPVAAEKWRGEEEGGSEGEEDFDQEELEGLEVEDMELISRMGL